MKSKEDISASFALLESFRESSLAIFYESMELDGHEITEELIDLGNHVWEDLENFLIMSGGDLNLLLQIGLEALIDTAIFETTTVELEKYE